jgi:transcriptional regulator with XRE-family HTH domain
MLNKAIKELMLEQGIQASVLCVAMGQSESTFSRMFINDNANPKASSLKLLAKRLNIKVSDIWLKSERLEPVICRFFYSASQKRISSEFSDGKCTPLFVYIGGKWVEYTEMTSSTGSSNFDDVVYLGEAPQWHIKVNGKIQCPDLYMHLCDEAKLASEKQLKGEVK